VDRLEALRNRGGGLR